MINNQFNVLCLVFINILSAGTTLRKNNNDNCLVPSPPRKGFYVVGSHSPEIGGEGTYVPPLTPLIVNCEKNYNPSPPGKSLSICYNGEWIPPPLKCARSCPSVESTDTTVVSCAFNGTQLNSCKGSVDGVKAYIRCAEFYEQPNSERLPLRRCIDGSWDKPFQQCSPVCGLKPLNGTAAVGRGKVAQSLDYPWHIGFYDAKRKGFICGGTLISPHAVVSAANCFSRFSDGEKYSEENYLVAAGKYYSGYYDERDINVQYSGIYKIFFPQRYKGETNQYEADIAVVILTTELIATPSVQPVCVDWTNNIEYQQVFSNTSGLVPGWGQIKTDVNSSNELRELSLTLLPYEQCYEQVSKSFQRFLTHDKVCSDISSSGQSICQGDGGGGLVYPHANNRYYLTGILSVRSGTGPESCSSNTFVTYTLMSKYLDFVKQLIFI